MAASPNHTRPVPRGFLKSHPRQTSHLHHKPVKTHGFFVHLEELVAMNSLRMHFYPEKKYSSLQLGPLPPTRPEAGGIVLYPPRTVRFFVKSSRRVTRDSLGGVMVVDELGGSLCRQINEDSPSDTRSLIGSIYPY